MKKRMKLLNLIFALLLIIGNSFTVMGAENEDLGSWSTKASNHIGREEFGIGVVNDKIYIVGGRASFEEQNITSLEEYDPITDKWTQKADIPTGRQQLGVAVANNKLYAIGGTGGLQQAARSVTVEEYNPVSNTWIRKADIPTGRCNAEVIAVNGKIYAIGGKDLHGNKIKTVEEYNPITDTWVTKAEMPTAREGFNLAEVNGKIYAIGGRSSIKDFILVEEYNPITDKWTQKADMPTKREDLGAVSLKGKIYVIGGSYGGTYYQKVEEYDPATDTWTTMADMPTGRSHLGVVALDNKIYAIDGLYPEGNPVNNIYSNKVEVFTLGASNQKPNAPINLTATPSTNAITLKWDAVDDVDSYTILRSTTSGKVDAVIASNVTDTTYIDKDVEPGVIYYYVVRVVKDGAESPNSSEVSATIKASDKKVKLVLEVNRQKQLSVTDDLTDNTEMTWTSSDMTIATVDANGKVKALKSGDTVITCTNKDDSYTETINVLVVDLDLQLAVDLNTGEKCRLVVGNLMNILKVTWKTDDSTIATVSAKGKVTAISEGLTYISALDETGKELGRIYVRVR